MDHSSGLTRRQTLQRMGAAGLGLTGLGGGLEALLAGRRSRRAGPGLAEGHRARHLPHPGEPLVRPLLRHAERRPRVRRQARRRGVPPEGPGRQDRHPVQAPLRRSPVLHAGHHPRLGAPAPLWNNGHMNDWFKVHEATTNGGDGPAAGIETMGYYNRSDLQLLLRARRRLHDLRRLPLLGDRADRPQPADVDERLAGSRGGQRAARWWRRSWPRAATSRASSRGRRCPSGSSPRA